MEASADIWLVYGGQFLQSGRGCRKHIRPIFVGGFFRAKRWAVNHQLRKCPGRGLGSTGAPRRAGTSSEPIWISLCEGGIAAEASIVGAWTAQVIVHLAESAKSPPLLPATDATAVGNSASGRRSIRGIGNIVPEVRRNSPAGERWGRKRRGNALSIWLAQPRASMSQAKIRIRR